MTYGLVICSYKYGHLAAHAIETALAQTKPFDKIWFVDDGVGDCAELPLFYRDKVNFVLRNYNMGIVANFNDMLQKADTDYVMFLGADNWLRSDTLQQLAPYTENHDIVTYDIVVTGELKNDIYKNYAHAMTPINGDYYWSRKMQHHGSMLYNTKLAKSVGGYAHNRTSDKTDEDLNLWDKMNKAGARVAHCEQGLLFYRRHKENFNKY